MAENLRTREQDLRAWLSIKAVAADPWPTWRWNAYAWDHDAGYRYAVTSALTLLAALARSIPNPDRRPTPCP